MTDQDLEIVEGVLEYIPELCSYTTIQGVALDCFGFSTVEDFIADELGEDYHLFKGMKKFLARFGGKSLGFIIDRDTQGTEESDISKYSALIIIYNGQGTNLVFMYNN